MTDERTPAARTLLSVRGNAHRTVPPDEATMSVAVRGEGTSTLDARQALTAGVDALLAALSELGGVSRTADTVRSAVTWATRAIATEEEIDYDHRPPRPTGRHIAAARITVAVRDLGQCAAVADVLTRDDRVRLEGVQWSVDGDNPAWSAVRADAIATALRTAGDYAAALGGHVLSVDHVADTGLLGGGADGSLGFRARASSHFEAQSAESGGPPSLDPVPQTVHATIEARCTATVDALRG